MGICIGSYPNLLELTGEALEKELVRRQQTKGYKVLTELPLCENGVGMFNQTRITLFLYLEATGEYRRITPEDYDVNHVNVRPGQVLFTDTKCGSRVSLVIP